jgi:hypothetical protein
LYGDRGNNNYLCCCLAGDSKKCDRSPFILDWCCIMDFSSVRPVKASLCQLAKTAHLVFWTIFSAITRSQNDAEKMITSLEVYADFDPNLAARISSRLIERLNKDSGGYVEILNSDAQAWVSSRLRCSDPETLQALQMVERLRLLTLYGE